MHIKIKLLIKNIVKKQNLDDKTYKVEKYEDELKLTKDRFYAIEAVNEETRVELKYILYDCRGNNSFDFNEYSKMIEHEDYGTIQVLLFKNWQEEMDTYYEQYNLLKTAKNKRQLNEFFDKKLSYYEDIDKPLSISVQEPVNYLEYISNNHKDDLYGCVYNVSFYELKKLYNVTGKNLFDKNIRKGLRNNITGKKIKNRFKRYINIYIYGELINLLNLDKKGTPDDNKLIKDEIKKSLMIQGDILKEYRAENFWFYHNGITIFSYDDKTINRSGGQIELNPSKVSVINGAQTLTNFYVGIEEIKKELIDVFINYGVSNDVILNYIEQATKNIKVKTIFINGDEEFVRPITIGLNTQIQVAEEHILADSDEARELNKILLTKTMEILKEGDDPKANNDGFGVLEFCKKYLIIKCEPGKSKNLNKKSAKETLVNALKDFKNEREIFLEGMRFLIELDEWWKNNKDLRLQLENDKELKELVPAENKNIIKTINSYGKNYFGSYVINNDKTVIDSEYFIVLYNSFVKDMIKLEPRLELADFKKDELFIKYQTQADKVKKDIEPNASPIRKLNLNDLKNYLESNITSSYSKYKVISTYLEKKDVRIDYFRVITRLNGKCKEAYPFPNTTFSELYRRNENDVDEYEKFYNSSLKKEIEKRYTVFIIEEIDNEKNKNIIKEIKQVEFSFFKYEKAAELVFNKTIEAFEKGDTNLFPRSSENLKFHIRPKAKDSDDTFEFSNGEQITKRTFWANKSTVDDIINENYNKL